MPHKWWTSVAPLISLPVIVYAGGPWHRTICGFRAISDMKERAKIHPYALSSPDLLYALSTPDVWLGIRVCHRRVSRVSCRRSASAPAHLNCSAYFCSRMKRALGHRNHFYSHRSRVAVYPFSDTSEV
ncbi:hypothetical protein B0H11DRAFT_2008956 [Mycena galericulata]|nr:hypothetical protein B0H11DRAFT_2008956 [Mycena galericulata]